MTGARTALVAALIAGSVSVLGVGALIHPWNYQLSVPVNMPTPDKVATMTDAELCQLEHRTLTGLDALRELGVSGVVVSFRYQWLVLFASIFAGCLAFRGLTGVLFKAQRSAA
jgi:hypothetical protein